MCLEEVNTMKKTLTILLTSLSCIMILDAANAGEAIVMFFLAGVVPGTSLVISGAHMLEFYMLVFGFILSRIVISLANTRHRLTAY